MSETPSIYNWTKNGLPWKWVYSPSTRPLTLAPGQEIKYSEHVHPEGILAHAIAAFDSPNCGIRLWADPDLDTARTQTIINTILGGGYSPNRIWWASVPPTTLPGIYTLNLVREVPWLNFVEFYIFNDDTVPHTFISGGYTMAVLINKRPTPADQELLEVVKKQKGVIV